MEAAAVKDWDRLDARSEALIRQVEGLGTEERRRRPSSREWSPIEVIDHLAQAEGLYAQWVIDDPAPGLAPRRNWKLTALVWVMRKALRTPTIREMEPRPLQDLDEAAEHLRRVRAAMRARLGDRDPAAVLVQHPFLGPLSACQVAEIFDAHLDYHVKRFPK